MSNDDDVAAARKAVTDNMYVLGLAQPGSPMQEDYARAHAALDAYGDLRAAVARVEALRTVYASGARSRAWLDEAEAELAALIAGTEKPVAPQ